MTLNNDTTQARLNRQLKDFNKTINCITGGKIIKEREDGKFLVKLNNSIQVNGKKHYPIILCGAWQLVVLTETLKINDEVLILYTDYNQDFPDIPIDINNTYKHSDENAIIICKTKKYDKKNNINIILSTDREDIQIKVKNTSINLDMNGNIVIDAENKVTIKNKTSDIKTLLNKFDTQIKAALQNIDTSVPTMGWANPPASSTAYGDMSSDIDSLFE